MSQNVNSGRVTADISGNVTTSSQYASAKTLSQTGGTNIRYPEADKFWIITCAWAHNDGSASQIDWYKGVHVATGSSSMGDLAYSGDNDNPNPCEVYIDEADCIRMANNCGITYYEFTK